MIEERNRRSLSRRDFLKVGAGAALAAAGAAVLPRFANKVLTPSQIARAADAPPDLYWAGTDGWIYLPPNPPIGFYHPDSYAPAPFTTYIFGFRNITGLDSSQIAAQKNRAQHSAPLFWVDEYQDSLKNEFRVQLTNLGLAQRPDLTDSHTLHWHGFRNVIPYYDGEPTGSVSVPVGRDFTYVFRPRDPGTYMYHCHVEDVEHVHMGMTGPVFVRPKQNGNTSLYPSGKFAYNDGNGSTGYDREFVMFLSEVWAEAHWDDAHIQLPDWSDYHPDFSLLNGRVFPDTLAPNAPVDPAANLAAAHAIPVQRTPDGDLTAPDGHPELQYQPLSALVTCQPGERVLLRFSNLGFREAAMTLAGIKMKVIGRDATLMRGRDGTDTSYDTDTIRIGPGEAFDVIFAAPAHSGGAGPDKYVLYNRRLTEVSNLSADGSNVSTGGFAGQRTEIHVYPSGLSQQRYPNDWGM